jgi:hypothetical protein
MNAFISYSLIDKEQFIITLLSNKLREQGFSLRASKNYLDFTTKFQISSSQLFIGLISYYGAQRQEVLQEWQHAIANKVPAVLLIENNVPVDSNFNGYYVRFDRNNPQPAIDEIHKKMLQPKPSTQVNNEALGWFLGGAAIIAIIALLGSKK